MGDNVLVSAHGNSLRSIVMLLDELSPGDVCNLELATGVPIIYSINAQAQVTDKTVIR